MFDLKINKWRNIDRHFRWYGVVAFACAVVIIGFNSIAVSQQPVTIKVLMSALEASQWQPLVEEFEAENPDIDLELVEGPNATNLVEDLYTSSFLLGNSPYDLVYMDIVWTPKFAAAGWLTDVSDRISDAQVNDFLAGDLNGGRYQGGLYRMPFRSDVGMLYYRQDLLSAAGRNPPETTAELIEVSRELQAQDKIEWGYVWQGRQYEGLAAMFVEILEGFGGFWIDPDTQEVGLDRPEAIAAVGFLRETIDRGISPSGVTTYQEEETRRFFQNGKALFLRNWPYVWALANADDSPVKGKIGLKPMVYAPGYESAACQGGWGLGIAKTSRHPDEAWRVIDFMTSQATQKKFILETGYVPSRRSLFSDREIVAKYSHYPQLLKVQESSVLRPPIAQYAQASDVLQRYLSSTLTERMTPEKAMERAAAETRNILGR